MYIGEKIRLREYRKEDIELAQKFVNDPEIKRCLTTQVPFLFTYEDELRWYEKISGTKETYNFAIESLEDGKYLGGCGINSIDWKNSYVIVGIFIGNKEYLGKGYGTDAMKTLMKFIFEQMNIHKIKLKVLSFNKRAIKSYEKCGFKIEGILREENFKDGRYYDEFEMGILKDEYYNLLKE